MFGRIACGSPVHGRRELGAVDGINGVGPHAPQHGLDVLARPQGDEAHVREARLEQGGIRAGRIADEQDGAERRTPSAGHRAALEAYQTRPSARLRRALQAWMIRSKTIASIATLRPATRPRPEFAWLRATITS